MKFAYKEKDCVDGNGGWKSCSGCIFDQLTDKRIWLCILLPHLRCQGPITFAHSNNLSDIFQV